MEVGFIGTGRMGKVMAANLLKAGHRVRAWDKSPAPLAACGRRRDRRRCGRCFPQRRGHIDAAERPGAARLHRRHLLRLARPSTVSVNMGTVSLDCVDQLVAAHAAYGVPYVAATVFGRPDVAAAAKLSIMAAGEPR